MKAALNRFMARIGYVPRASVDELKLQIERLCSSIEESKVTLTSALIATQAFDKAIASLNDARVANTRQSTTTELTADPAHDELLNEVRALIEEIRQERHENFHVRRDVIGVGPGGASNSGLPG
jgi:transcriptional regulator with AAA-type ATPase domain